MPNSWTSLRRVVGAAKLGAIPVPINGRFKEHELSHVDCPRRHHGSADRRRTGRPRSTIRRSSPGLSRRGTAGSGALRVESAPLLRALVHLNGERAGFLSRAAFDAAARGVGEEEIRALQARVRIRDVAMLMYTSGTTAQPKGCLLTPRGARPPRRQRRSGRSSSLTAEDRFWDPLPLFHIGGIVPMLGCLGVGRDVRPRRALRRRASRSASSRTSGARSPTRPSRRSGSPVLDHPRFARGRPQRAAPRSRTSRRPSGCATCSERMPWAAVQSPRFGATESRGNLTLRAAPTTRYEARIDDARHAAARAWRSGSSTRRPARSSRPGETGELLLARLRAASRATTRTPSRRRRRSTPTAGSTPATSAASTSDGRLVYVGPAEGHAQGRRRERRRARDRGLPRRATRRSRSCRSSARPTRATPRCRPRSSSSRRARALTEEELIDFCLGQIATFKVPRYVRFVDRVADVGDEDPEVRAARADRRRARGARDHRGAEGHGAR